MKKVVKIGTRTKPLVWLLGKKMAWGGCDWYSFCKFANYGGIVCSYSILSVEMYILRLLFDARSTPSGFRICGCAFD